MLNTLLCITWSALIRTIKSRWNTHAKAVHLWDYYVQCAHMGTCLKLMVGKYMHLYMYIPCNKLVITVMNVCLYHIPCSYSEKKGFHCLSVNGKFHCLGPSKGRQYPDMETADEAFLRDFYRHDNLVLRELLKRFSYRTPTWLMMSS